MSETFDTRPNSPVVAGSGYLGNGNWTIPLFNKLYVQIKGGDGGQSGAYGVNGCVGGLTPSGNGGAGGASYFGPFLGASGGAGGSGDRAAGGVGQTTSLYWDADANNGYLAYQGYVLTSTVGGGGAGGGGGANPYTLFGVCVQGNAQPGGAAGAAGYVYVSWS